ncbi:MAG: hypothetical protein INR73_15895 [Williamsia sp.]|nr:hypothetical protein [Williamsia sp.]
MKKFASSALLSLFWFFSLAQSTWTWLQGDAFTPRYGRYGIKGVANSTNRPGVRSGFATWKEPSGDIWMFGGNGNAATGSGFLNDLWKYSPSTDTWTWISGDVTADRPGVYGSKGVSSPRNMIRSRANPVSWMDAAGNLWLFGGETFRAPLAAVSFFTDDLWKFTVSTGQWTWMGGDTAYASNAVYGSVYGTKGVPAASNKPGSRALAAGWTDNTGNLWLFGGYGAGSASLGPQNDLWKYSISDNVWTWISGDNSSTPSAGRYETKGIGSATTRPGAKVAPTSWTDKAGNFWLFGGNAGTGGVPDINKFANDLWMFAPSSSYWTWISGDSTLNQTGVYGSKGISAAGNKPGARNAAAGWTDTSGNFFVYAGTNAPVGSSYYNGPTDVAVFNDLWKFSPATSQWTWLWGDTATSKPAPVYGLKGVASDTAKPASVLYGTRTWTDDANDLWLSNGDVLWKYAQTSGQWTWVRGDTSTLLASAIVYPGSYGTQGLSSPSNQPRARRYATTWTDASGIYWMYGGMTDPGTSTAYYNYLNDLWKYDPATHLWTWMNGDSVLNKPPVYGTQGMSSAAGTPGARRQAASWSDAAGNLWLFGGYSANASQTIARYADLWKYTPSTGEWTWINGTSNTNGRYGTKGVSTAATYPGCRYAATTWTDAAGNFWLFGGDGYAGALTGPTSYASRGKLNDLWEYTPVTNRWTWMSGDSTTNISLALASQAGVYGTKGVAGTSNKPGGRNSAAGWMDPAGNCWLFGGITNPGGYYQNGSAKEAYLNDLWKYTPGTGLWTWISGSNTINQNGIFSSQGVPGSNIVPGARRQAVSWTDNNSNLYLFGGNADSITDYTGTLTKNFNDLWRYSIATDQWTWVSGDSALNQPGLYGTLNVPSSANKPGARDGVMNWSDNTGSLWLFSGFGYPEGGYRFLNDMMKFSPASSLPVLFSSFRAQRESQSAALYWITAQEQNSRSFVIERSADGIVYNKIGTIAAAGTVSTPTSYSFTDLSPLPGNNYYRLKEVDLDDKSMYSLVVKVYMGDEPALFVLLNNPVQYDVQVSLLLSSARKVQLEVRDAGGRLILNRAYTGSKGTNLFRLPVDGLSKGTYFLHAASSGMQGTKSFLKQ